MKGRRLRIALLASLALAASIALAACGGDDDGGVGGASDNEAETATTGDVTGEFNISNWVGYIDKGEGSTIADFEAKYPGTTVNYTEDVNDNAEFFGKVQPLLDQGESGGRIDDGRHRLDGEADERPGLPPGDRLRRPAERRGEPARRPAQPGLRPGPRVLGPVADRHDRPARQRAGGPGHRVGQRPVRPEVQGQGHGADRDARHGAADAEGPGHRPGRGDQGGVARRDPAAAGRRRLGPAPPLHRQRLRPGPDERQRRRVDRMVG